MAAVPPFLQPCCETHREERQHSGRRPRTGLEQLHCVRRTTPRRKVRHKATTDTTPTRLLTAPDEATAGPRKFIAIEKTATGTDHPEAVLPPWTGVHRAVCEEPINLRLQRSCRGGGRHPSINRTSPHCQQKATPGGWLRTLSDESRN